MTPAQEHEERITRILGYAIEGTKPSDMTFPMVARTLAREVAKLRSERGSQIRDAVKLVLACLDVADIPQSECCRKTMESSIGWMRKIQDKQDAPTKGEETTR